MSVNIDTIKHYFESGYYTTEQVCNMVKAGAITIENYETITGEALSEESILEVFRIGKLKYVSAACKTAIHAGVDVTLGEEVKHFSLTEEDQINLSTALKAIEGGATGFPYHADGELCRIYTAEEINAIMTAAMNYKIFHTTLCNHLNMWIKAETNVETLEGITYANTVPEIYRTSMNTVLGFDTSTITF